MNKNVKNALIIAGVLSAVTAPSVKASEHMIIDSDTSVNQNFNDYSSNSPQYGGAIYQSGGSLNVEGGKFSGNVINGEGQTSVYGGAIGTTGGTLTIYDNVEFTGNSTNSAAASGGGALALQNGNQTTIGNDVSFNNNSSYCGGAIYTATNDVIAGNNNTFSGNSAGFAGGAIYNGSSAAGTANMTIGSGTTISNNDAQYGGGIYNLGYGGKTSNVTIGSNSNISGNTASKDGGAIYNDIDSDKNISNIQINGGSTVSNNTASGNGGAVYNNGNFKLDTADGNITFSGNKANGSANDIYQAATGSTVITGDGNTITMDGGFAGSGTIDKTGSNTLVMNSDNSAYTGTFNQTAGKTTSKGKFFGGQNKITNSELELGDNSELVKDSTTDLESSGKITVSGNNVQINGEVKGQTGSEINKTAGSGTLDIDGSKGAKTDGFNGKFKQEGGTTNVKDTNLFANTEIKDGTVNLNTGANIASNGSIDLSGSGAILNNNGNNITFTNDSTISGAAGSQINNSGNLTVNGQNAASGFDGNYAQSSGTTTITDANMFSNSTINGGSVTIGTNGGISTNGSINLAGNNTSLTINSDAKDITFTANSTISGSAASTVTNNNNVILNGTDTSGFNGKYIQNQGKTDVTNSTMFANSDIKSGTVNFNAGANIASNGNINLGTDAILNNTAANTNIIEFTANSTITGETGSKFNNDGKVSLNGTDTSGFKGKYTQDGNGNIDVKNSTLFADTEVKSGTVNLNEGANIASKGNINLSGSGATLNNNAVNNNTITFTADSTITGVEGSKFNNDGKVSLNGTDTSGFKGKYTQDGNGNTDVQNSTLFADTEVKSGTINLNEGANIASKGNINLSGSGATLNNNAVNNNTITFTADSTITGVEGSKFNNSGKVSLNGTDTSGFKGDYTQNSGKTDVSNSTLFANTEVKGGTINLNEGANIASNGSINLSGSGAALNNNGNNITFTNDSTISGVVDSQINNSGNITVNGQNAASGFNGNYTQSSGTTTITDANMFANSTIKGGTVDLNTGANIASKGNINLSGSGAILNNNGNNITFTNDSTISGAAGSQINNSGNITVNGQNAASGFNGDYAQSSGTTTITDANMFSNSTINGGSVTIGTNGGISTNGSINLAGNNTSLTINSDAKDITFTANSTISGSATSTVTNNNNVILNGTDTSGFNGKYIQNQGKTDVTNSTMFANTEIKDGTLNLNDGANIASNGSMNLSGSGATLNNNGNNITFTNDSTISGAAGSQINNSGNLTVNGKNAASGFNGDYNQNEGNTTIIDADMFSNSTINGGSVTIGTNGGITADGYLNLAGENTSLTINSDAKDIAFTDNSILSGSATSSVINNGTISVDGHNAISGFNGKYVQNAGSISIDNADMFKDAAIAGGTVTIKTNGNLSDNSKLALNGESTQLNIEGTGNHQFNDVNITGNGQINNASSGELALKGDYSGFDGKYNQTAGLTTITGTDADNMSTMFKNVTIDGDGTELKLGNFSTLAEGGSVNITNKGTLTFAGEQILNNNTIIGSADSFVKKESSGKLTINNSDYSGFLGTYQQTDGLTLADHSAFFSKLDITGGELQLVNGSTLNSSAEQTDLSFGAKLTMEDSTAIFNGTGTNNFKEDVSLENSNLVIKEGAAFDKDVTLTSSIINIGTSEVEGAVKDAVFGGNLISNGTADAQSGILVNGNMSVAKNTQLYYTVMDVKGDALFSGTLDIKGEGSSTPGTEWHVAQLGVGGNLTVADDKASNMEYTYADIKGDAAFGGTTEVSNSQINVGGDSIFKKAFTAIDSFFDFKKNASFNDNVNIASTVENQASTMAVGGDLKVDGTTTLDNAVVKVGGNAIFGKDSSAPITARNAGDIDDLSNSVINIAGTGTFNNEVIAQNTTIKTGDDASFKETVLANDSLLIFDKNVTFDKEIKTGVSNLENNILTVGENLVANGKFDLNNTLANVGGDVTLNEASKFTGSILDVAKNFTSTSGNVDLTDSRLTVMGQTTVENGDTTLTNSTLSLNGNADFKQNLTVGQDSVLKFLNPNSTFNVDGIFTVNNGTVDVMNNVLNNNIINNDMIIDGTSSFAIDIDPRGWKSDTFTMNGDIKNVGGAGAPDAYITISDFNLTSVPIDRHIYLPQLFQANGEIAENVKFLDSEMSKFTPIGWYQMQGAGIGNTNGYRLSLIKYNPQVFRGQVATVANYQNQLVTNNILFDHIQEVSLRYLAEESPNKYAASYPQFAPYQYDKKDGSLWFKAYGTLEKLGMSQGLNVENNFYGVLAGADFPVMKLKNGWSFLPTAYVGYNGAHQVFNKVGMTQNGGQGGFMGTFMKNDFIGSLLAYGGGYGNEMDVAGYTDTTGNWYAGTAAKAAYNFHPTKHFIIQPTALVSYNFFGNQNWHTNFGDMSMSSGYLNGVNVAPGLNLIYGRETWSIYGTIQYFYNIMGYSEGQAGNVGLPGIAMRHGFLEYGLGFTKTFKDRLSAYLQITLRNGGRTGVGFQGGLQYKL